MPRRSPWGLLLVPLLLAGCSGGAKHRQPKKTPPEEAAEPKAVNVGAGENTQRSSEANRERQWTVDWQSAQIDTVGTGGHAGRMRQVSGTIYEKDKPVGTFQGDSGFADQTKQVLLLKGKVRIVSNDPKLKATLYADEVRYDARDKIVRAIGNVRVESDLGTLSPVKELWATPDLKTFGTPDMFKR